MAADPNAQRYLRSIGLQLWTVRDQMERDMAGTLRTIQSARYAQIELMRTLNARDIIAPARAWGWASRPLSLTGMPWRGPAGPDCIALAEHLAIARETGLRYLAFGYIGKGVRERRDPSSNPPKPPTRLAANGGTRASSPDPIASMRSSLGWPPRL